MDFEFEEMLDDLEMLEEDEQKELLDRAKDMGYWFDDIKDTENEQRYYQYKFGGKNND